MTVRAPGDGQLCDESGELVTSDPPVSVARAIDGAHVQVLELRGTIIRLREQLDRIHARYEEKVQRLESLHRTQRRELEETIRHLRERLRAAAGYGDGD